MKADDKDEKIDAAPAQRAWAGLQAHTATRGILVTDGKGRSLARSGCFAGDERSGQAEALDIAAAALSTYGRVAAVGALRVSFVEFEEGSLLLGATPTGERIAAITAPDSNMGWLLVELRAALQDPQWTTRTAAKRSEASGQGSSTTKSRPK